MNDSELEDIAPGLLKIQQVLGHKDSNPHSVSDNKTLLIDALLHLAELMDVSLKIPSGDLGDDLDDLMEKISTHSGIRIHKMTLEDKWWSYDLGIFLGFMDNSPCAS